jgi:hypothetical protein
LSQGARAQGFRNELWTLKRIATGIDRHFDITYCPSGGWHLLRRLGWSPQKPARRARERDEDAIAAWPKAVWPTLKKKPGVSIAPSSSLMKPASCCNPWCAGPRRLGGKRLSITVGTATIASR